MFQAKRQAAFSTWQAPGHELEVVYSQVVMHEIVLRALDGLHSMPGVGLEVGGILFGTADENEVRITASRELPCAHSKGQAFLLNEADEGRLERFLAYYREETDLAGLAPVGFYVSRTRNELALGDADVKLLEKYFPEPQQVVLVLKVAGGRPTRAGFFVREADGSLQKDLSHKEFEAAPASEAGVRPLTRSERETVHRTLPVVVPIRPADEIPSEQSEESGGWTAPEELMDRPRRHPWPWKTLLVAMGCFAALASVILYMRGARVSAKPKESVGLRLTERSAYELHACLDGRERSEA